MASCERCWELAKVRGVEYAEQLRDAQANNEPCAGTTPEAYRLQAGQFWDEATQRDTRFPAAASPEGR